MRRAVKYLSLRQYSKFLYVRLFDTAFFMCSFLILAIDLSDVWKSDYTQLLRATYVPSPPL